MPFRQAVIDISRAFCYNGRMMANKINYDNKMQEMLKTLPQGTRLLLHSCCAPCSTACLERLSSHFSITVLYYNPNIDDVEEYEKRKAEQKRLLQETGWGDFLDCDHETEAFAALAKGLESEPERGSRCYLCYALRLKKTAEMAKDGGYACFATTLTLSPLKNVEWLNEIGAREGERVGILYLCSDFKKKGGYLRSTQLSKEYGLYRQDYCGCSFSKKNREEK